jgi:hypothetical protein
MKRTPLDQLSTQIVGHLRAGVVDIEACSRVGKQAM